MEPRKIAAAFEAETELHKTVVELERSVEPVGTVVAWAIAEQRLAVVEREAAQPEVLLEMHWPVAAAVAEIRVW